MSIFNGGFLSFLIAVGAVTLAEMGDKTQLLAMCFATRFSARKVLIGVFLATILNHALAVAAGYFLKEVLASYTLAIQVVASLSFIGFGLWTIRGDKVDDACERKTTLGPIITVAIAFFIAEMGDKTQLTTVSLAAKFDHPMLILVGTTAGMLIADGLGIIFGVVMNKKIPEKTLKWISASVFTLCGFVAFIQAVYKTLQPWTLIGSVALIALVTVVIAAFILKTNPNAGVFEEIAVINRQANTKDK